MLSDIGLPGGMTGVDLATELQARNHPARLRLMTSLPAGDALRRAAPCPVLGKPFTQADLAAFLAMEAP
ncbi:PAS/PAC sensor hybrid histidine kinase [Frigidibacter mobilis]|uniref:PAS/PAC sensor hybrid histidine kinase n=1 Tax=Frigidibacter mobilis TaxID=1335048 RepID=A0A165SUY2_9RHOB|nr:PAS/PAC sensor hybrid histidine kinase [Frigidibacter mobilis]